MYSQKVKPFLYCDIDGVINIATKKNPTVEQKIIFRRLPTKIGEHFIKIPLRFTWQTSILSTLALMNLNLYWLTTWNHQAITILEPFLGLKSVGMLEYRLTFREIGNQKQKYELLKKHQKTHKTPFIWVDDVATKFYDAKDFDETQPHLIIRTNKKQGITDGHIEDINNFLINFS